MRQLHFKFGFQILQRRATLFFFGCTCVSEVTVRRGEAKPSKCHSEEPVVIDVAFTPGLHSRIKGKISTTAKKEHSLYHLNEMWQKPHCGRTGSQAASPQPTNQGSTVRKQANRSILPLTFPQPQLHSVSCNTSTQKHHTRSPDHANSWCALTLHSRRQDAVRPQIG